jgi:hypothetical protein
MALNITSSTRWEDAAPKVTALIAGARRSEDEDLAATWSAAKELLKRKLPRGCPGANNVHCGVTIGYRAQTCRACSNKARWVGGKEYRSYKPETGAVAAWIRSKETFFFDELFYATKQLSPGLSRNDVNRRAHGVIRGLRKRKEVSGGGIKNDRRYVVHKITL